MIIRELKQTKVMTFQAVIVQMFLLNIVFSIDSVITAVGMAEHRMGDDGCRHCFGDCYVVCCRAYQ